MGEHVGILVGVSFIFWLGYLFGRIAELAEDRRDYSDLKWDINFFYGDGYDYVQYLKDMIKVRYPENKFYTNRFHKLQLVDWEVLKAYVASQSRLRERVQQNSWGEAGYGEVFGGPETGEGGSGESKAEKSEQS